MFVHTVRGPLAAVAGNWRESQPPKNLLDYINGFRHRLYTAGGLAKEKLASAQDNMKHLYDRQPDVGQVHAAGVATPVLVEFPSNLFGCDEDWLATPDQALLRGCLKNSEALCKVDKLLTHLLESRCAEVVQLIKSFPCLFGDTPSRTLLL